MGVAGDHIKINARFMPDDLSIHINALQYGLQTSLSYMVYINHAQPPKWLKTTIIINELS